MKYSRYWKMKRNRVNMMEGVNVNYCFNISETTETTSVRKPPRRKIDYMRDNEYIQKQLNMNSRVSKRKSIGLNNWRERTPTKDQIQNDGTNTSGKYRKSCRREKTN